MLIGNFPVVGLRGEILRRLQRLLHLCVELIDAHKSPSAIARVHQTHFLACAPREQICTHLIAASASRV